MNSEEDRPVARISYEKPTAVDLGPAAPVVGESCATGGFYETRGHCSRVGNGATGNCTGEGNSAAGGHCADGNDVLP